MSDDVFTSIENDIVRRFAEENIDALVKETKALLDFDAEARKLVFDALDGATLRLSFAQLGPSIFGLERMEARWPDWLSAWEQFKRDAERRVWECFCDRTAGGGVPKEEWVSVFDAEGWGTRLLKRALVAACAALAASAGAAGVLVESVLRTVVEQMVVPFVASLLDQYTEGTLGQYCAVVP